MQIDQEARWRWIRERDGWETVQRIDRDNTAWLAGILEEHGWPGAALVGEDGAHAAWLIAQHADDDRAFQRLCLNRMSATPAGDVAPLDLAYLTDRVLIAESSEQVYGTQCTSRDGEWQPLPLREPDTVDARRAAVGLSPLREYLAQITETYGPPAH